MDHGMEQEALESERLDADREQAELEALGRSLDKRHRRMERLLAEGKTIEAARVCSHDGGYPLRSIAAEDLGDPRKGQSGWRCSDCGSVLSASPWDDGVVTVPCDWRKRV